MAQSGPPTLPRPQDRDRGTAAGAHHEPPQGRGREARRPRRPRSPEIEDGRRLASAGHALAVCALGLLFALVLNAAGAHKHAYNQSDGWKRDVALAVTGPLDSVSGVLRLDRPREAVLAAMGRSGADDIDSDLGIDVVAPPPIASPTKPAPSTPVDTTATTAPPHAPSATKPVFTPQRPLRLWVAGDSLVITPGYAILRAVGTNRAVKSVGGVEGRVATGLTRPDVFNWFREIRSRVRADRLDAVVVSFGGNDDKAYMTGLPEGVTIGEFGDDAWKREYARRVGALFDLVARQGGHTVWIGLPQTNDPAQTQRFDVINGVVVKQAKKRPDTVTFIDTYLLLAGSDGGYAQYLDLPGQGTVKARADDGVHFEQAGGDLIADDVVRELGKKLDFTGWRTASTP